MEISGLLGKFSSSTPAFITAMFVRMEFFFLFSNLLCLFRGKMKNYEEVVLFVLLLFMKFRELNLTKPNIFV